MGRRLLAGCLTHMVGMSFGLELVGFPCRTQVGMTLMDLVMGMVPMIHSPNSQQDMVMGY